MGDARAFADELRFDGFDVEIGENLTKEGMRRTLDGFYARIRPGSVALLFFSGYGIQAANHQSYMIPVDAQVSKEEDIAREGISVDHVLSEIKDRGAAVKVIILDASRRSRFENFRRAPLGLALPANPPGDTLVMYSAAPGSVTRETASDHGLFVTELIKEMRRPNLQGEEALNRTRISVSRATAGEQIPLIYSSLSADFSFGSYKDDQNQLPSGAEARLDYELAAQIGTSAAWEVFLRKHPSGFYAELAKEQIAKVNAPAPRPPMAATPDQQVVDAPPKPNLPFIQPPRDPEVKLLSDRIKSSPQDANAFYKRGIYYAKSGDFALAIKDFDEVIRLQPRDAEAFNNRCWARAMIADLQRALDDCTHALELRPGYADALDSRGFVNLKLGKPAEAIIDYDAALKLSRSASSLYGRGLAKKRIGDAVGGDKDIIAARALDPEIVNQFATDNIGQQFPEFPWPPPKSSALYVIPRDMFVDKAGTGAPKLADIQSKLTEALDGAAYYERSYYSVPGGFAMVTRMERIRPDGSPDRERRWMDIKSEENFSLVSYIRRLLFADPGYFRLIVFILTAEPFAATGTPLSPEQGHQLLDRGFDVVPEPTLRRTFSPEHHIVALVYEFSKEKGRDPKLVAPGKLPARTHLEKALVWAGLQRAPARQ